MGRADESGDADYSNACPQELDGTVLFRNLLPAHPPFLWDLTERIIWSDCQHTVFSLKSVRQLRPGANTHFFSTISRSYGDSVENKAGVDKLYIDMKYFPTVLWFAQLLLYFNHI